MSPSALITTANQFFFFHSAGHFHPVVLFPFTVYILVCATRRGSGILLSKKRRLLICVTPAIILKQADSFNKTFLQGKKELYFTGSSGKAGIYAPRRILPAAA